MMFLQQHPRYIKDILKVSGPIHIHTILSFIGSNMEKKIKVPEFQPLSLRENLKNLQVKHNLV